MREEDIPTKLPIIPIARIDKEMLVDAFPWLDCFVLQTGFGEFIIPKLC